MREMKIYCDHCGRELDDMNDYLDTEITLMEFRQVDLCSECIAELDEMIEEFVKGGVK